MPLFFVCLTTGAPRCSLAATNPRIRAVVCGHEMCHTFTERVSVSLTIRNIRIRRTCSPMRNSLQSWPCKIRPMGARQALTGIYLVAESAQQDYALTPVGYII